ncbi:unnamed protein product [Paramecium sonneborni]|uniref:Uncharacterized protein n=1 Tax=Paramecium sonneborni TaxID=65129 RepID=A0A8S1NBY9_9CILI|nr:unnamed protein product [Paramecium sonneborni]
MQQFLSLKQLNEQKKQQQRNLISIQEQNSQVEQERQRQLSEQ